MALVGVLPAPGHGPVGVVVPFPDETPLKGVDMYRKWSDSLGEQLRRPTNFGGLGVSLQSGLSGLPGFRGPA